MELHDALARRRACRRFAPRPVERELLDRLAAAAHAAPTASNVPYRQVMVVDDPRVIRAVRQISPSLLAEPPALIVILTDVELAVRRVGPIGEASSLIDSGAAGENVWLAAIDAGLATQFTMISTMPGIRVVLGLPERMRVDLIMPVGHPAEGEPTGPVRRRRRPIHHDQFDDGA
ncbi:MAG: nitroreductase family protein [Solirubrobacteraceae bacterium]|nr:nitroreductase family protein [Solirubrobacteraceae bacterium]